MFSWFRGSAPAQPEVPAPDVKVSKITPEDASAPPQDSAPMFAVNALKTAVFGTPAPAKAAPGSIAFRAAENPPPQPIFSAIPMNDSEARAKGVELNGAKRRALTSKPMNLANRRNTNLFDTQTSKDSGNDGFTFKVTNRKTIFDKDSGASEDPVPTNLFEATPARPTSANPFEPRPGRPASPTKSILVPRGTAASVGPKKAVSFHPSLSDETPEAANRRVRSGLPHEFPGKFPSPWTPRTGQTPKIGERRSMALDDSSKPNLQPTGSKRTFDKVDVSENTRIEDIIGDLEPESVAQRTANKSDNIADFNAPRSASGQYWKNHSKTIEDLALTKVDKLRERCHTAIEYAKKKDELCVNLAEKLRETLDKNKLLKDELRRINRWSRPDAHKDESVLAEAMHLLSDKELKLSAAEEEMKKMQALLEQYATKVQTFEEILDHREDKITELSMNLYDGGLEENAEEQIQQLKQKLERAKNQAKEVGPLRLQCTSLQSTVNSLKREKARLETRLSLVSTSGSGTSASFSTINPDVEARLKTRIDELEKAKRELQTETRTKLNEASKQRREAEKVLRNEISDLKATLITEQLDKQELQDQVDELHAELLAHGKKDIPSLEWQQKHRATLEELRRVKEELDQLKLENNSDVLFRLHEGASQAFIDPEPIQNYSSVRSSGNATSNRASDRQEARTSRVPSFSKSPRRLTTERNQRQPSPPRSEITDTFDLSRATPHMPTPIASQTGPPPKLDFNFNNDIVSMTPQKFTGSESWINTKPSPRPSVVSWSPPKKKVSNIASRNPRPSTLDNMDPERKAAAERRIAERKAARRAAGL